MPPWSMASVYGAVVTCKYDSVIWKQVETFWRYIAKCILRVPMRTPSGGVYGYLTWSPFWVRAAHQATGHVDTAE
jgi:hypothetical protein